MTKLDFLHSLVDDVYVTKGIILGSAAIAMVLGMFWMVIMKMCAGVLIWCTILLLIVCSCLITYYMFD